MQGNAKGLPVDGRRRAVIGGRRWLARAGALAAALVALAAASAPALAQSTERCPWLDASRPAEERARLLLGAMTLDEKVRLTYGSLSRYGFASEVPANDRLCIPAFVQSDGPAGIAGGFGGTQAGVTAFPVGMAQGATWNVALNRRLGQVMGREALLKGANVLLAPALNINRVPQNGRNFEYFGEDPYLSGRITVAQVRGIQTNPVVATLKHYAVNNQETERMTVSAEVDERTRREIYLPAFEAGVKEGRAGSVMCAYNRVNGTYACEHRWLLTDVLKRGWGFDGWVMSDWYATQSTTKAALAGLDQEQASHGPTYYGEPLKAAVQAGEVPMARLDDMVLRVLRPAFRLGLFDRRPRPQPGAFSADVSTGEHRKVALEVAEQGSVLLENADGVLPLDRLPAGARIAVIGRPASQPAATAAATGSGSAHVNAVAVDPLTAIRERAAAEQAVVSYATGDSTADAVAAAAAADVAIVFVRDLMGEGNDRQGMSLNQGACVVIWCAQTESNQDEMIAAVAGANANTVVVALTGGPVLMPWIDRVKGVLAMWYPGQLYGTAAAALLFGDANPSGKLPQSFPKRVEDLPFRVRSQYPGENGKVVYSEGLQVGYRWYDAQRIEPLFPFGFGLSYTRFRYRGLTSSPQGDGATVSFGIANVGERDGAEVGQVYVAFPRSTGEPPQQLKGFRKVALEAGRSRRVTVRLDRRAFAHWDTARNAWVQARGCYRLLVGSSSRDIRLRGAVPIARGTCRLAAPHPRRCTTRRSVRIAIRGVSARAIRRVAVYVDGERQSRVARAGRRVRVRLPDAPGRTVRVRIVAATRSGGRVVDNRAYRICAERRSGR